MFLKRLELFGFKTFSKKTEIDFPQGFLAVVGPNGSGKSNLTDAIRFCLGENSVKAMRATRLDELIFAGTPTRKGAPYAEVTAIFDNSDQALPVDLSEVAITRRLEPGGDSKFQINKASCRLKDVHELLMGSGVGPGSFSVLGGKEVDQVLSSDPEDRRSMLEETAGVNRYRFRKREAQRRLERTAANLTRLWDIHKEIQAQLEESQRQLSRYEKYRQAQVELGGLERDLAAHEWLELEAAREALQQRCDGAQADLDQVQGQELVLRQELELLTQSKRELDAAREEKALEVSSQREQAGVCRANYDALFRRASELEHSARLAVQRLESAGARLEDCQAELDHLQLRLPEARREVDRAQERVDELRDQLNKLPCADQGPTAQARQRRSQVDRDQAQTLSRLEVLAARGESDLARLTELAQEIPTLTAQVETLMATTPLLGELKERLQAAEAEVEQAKAARQQVERQLEEARQQSKRLESERRPAVSRVAELEALLEDRSGLPPAVRAVMHWKEPGTVGLLGELIQVPTGLEQAFEAALGGHLNDVITQDRKVASRLIERLKQERIGRVTFWPLDLDRQPPPAPQLPDRRGVVGLALDLLGYPPETQAVLNEILGRTVIMEDLPVALALYDRCRGRRPHLVTRGGEYLNPSGALTGGAHKSSQTGLLARRRAMEEARAQLKSLEERLAGLAHSEETAQSERQLAEQRLNQAREASNQAGRELADQQAEARRRQADLERALASLRKQQQEQASLQQRTQAAAGEREQLQARQQELAAQQTALEEQLARLQAEESRIMGLRDSLQHQLMEAELNLERRRQAEAELVRERERFGQRQNELAADQDEAHREQERCQVARHQLESEGGQLQQEMQRLEAEVAQGSLDLEALKKTSGERTRQFDELSRRHQGLHSQTKGASERLHGLQVELAGLLAHSEEARVRLQEHAPEGELRRLEADDLTRTRGKAQRLRHFLESFGSVNLGAREDHERLAARHDELATQLKDLEDGAQSLKKIMAELDQVTVTQFREAFRRVNETFARTFTDLFHGGTARLELVDPEDLLESGVEIVACPPGKKLQSLTLLSSGERALSAMAFLLALLTCKPSPIVILDELDAPLDDSNVERVAKRLLEFSASSQFLVITHNRKTMEFADRLYGVTMEEPGSSRILSVRLSTEGQQVEAQASEGVGHHV